jgi:adenylylsulfate reductase subunit B
MPAVIDKKKCQGCGICVLHCPLDVIAMQDGVAEVEYPEECWHCGACRQDCASGAVSILFSPVMLTI